MQGRSMQKSGLTEAGSQKSAGKQQFRNFPATHELIPEQHCWHSPRVKSSYVFCCLVIKKPSLLKPQRQFNTAALGRGHTHRTSLGTPTDVPKEATRAYLGTVTHTRRVLAQRTVPGVPKDLVTSLDTAVEGTLSGPAAGVAQLAVL